MAPFNSFIESAGPFFQWFAGGTHPYHTLYHCMGNDTLWVTLTVVFDLTVAAGYTVIAYHWWQNQRNSPNTPAKAALRNMRNIFIFCAFCGYVFIPVKMFWPAWRLYDMFMAFLVYYTWRYALGAMNLKVIYNELGQSQKLKEDLEKSQEESRQKSFFLNAISHDLRTPLNGLLLQAQVARLSVDSQDEPGLRQAVKEMEAGARATADLLDALLQCARLDWIGDPVQKTTFDLDEVLAMVIAGSQAQASQKGLNLRLECPLHLRILTDKVKLERIVANLVANAVKFTDTGSVRVAVQTAASGLEIHVVDTGQGMSPQQQEHAFDEFYQVQNRERDRSKGFGLGLAIARRMARQLGGDIELESALGSGSRFSVLLPGAVTATADTLVEPSESRSLDVIAVGS